MSGEQPPLPSDLVERLSVLCDGGFVDVTGSLLQLYQHKTETDVAGLQLAHQVASLAVKTFYEEVRQTPTEARLAALIECAVQETIGRDGIDFAKAWPMVQSGRHAADAGRFNRSTGKIIGKGELVVLEMGLCVNGYWTDITRTALVGKATDGQLRMFETVRNAQSAAIASMRPGMPMRDVDAAARGCIEEAGLGPCFNHALGHHVGFRYHDPGDVLSPWSNGVLQEGMVLTVEPGVYGPDLGGGVRIEDNILITGDGHLLLSDYPRTMKGE
jgi:Xaa-Pro dipeptidase